MTNIRINPIEEIVLRGIVSGIIVIPFTPDEREWCYKEIEARPACGGEDLAEQIYRGGPYQHFKSSEQNVQKYANTTLVDDWACPEDDGWNGDGIPPYPRLAGPDLVGGGGDCPGGTANCRLSTDDPCTDSEKPLCGPWVPGDFHTCISPPPPASGVVRIDNNCYSIVPGEYVDYSKCQKIGFKAVQAGKWWQGRFGWVSHDFNGFSGIDDWQEAHCSCAAETEQPAADDTKYLRLAVTALKEVTGTVGTFEQAVTLGRYDGVQVLDSCEAGGDHDNSVYAQGLIVMVNGSGIAQVISKYCALLAIYDGDPAYSVVETGSAPDFHLEISQVSDTDNPLRFVADLHIPTSLADTASYVQTTWGYRSPSDTFGTLGTTTFKITNTNWHYRLENHGVDGPLPPPPEEGLLTTDHGTSPAGLLPPAVPPNGQETVDATLTEEYKSADVYEDQVAMLALWDLSDDIQYPWRTDPNVTVNPLVTRNEHYTAGLPAVGVACDYVDPAGADFDGTIIGAPLPPGYGPHFDWRHKTWRACLDGGGILQWFIYGYGARRGDINLGDITDSVMPLSATQWTDNFTASNLRPGAWLIFNNGFSMAQKWAEIQVRRPSYNFARPCGDDRFLLDEPGVRCITDVSGDGGGTLFVVTIASETNIATNDWCLVCWPGGSAANGLWKVKRLTATTYELETRVGAGPSGDCGTGIFGKLRFPLAPRACTGPWADSEPKGDFVYVSWMSNYRDFAEKDRMCGQYAGRDMGCAGIGPGICMDVGGSSISPLRWNQSQHGMDRDVIEFNAVQSCLPFIPCCPSVLCISPSGENFTNGRTFAFPDAFGLDERYGAKWQAAFVQHMVDPLWEPPHKPCVEGDTDNHPTNCAWSEDDGSCAEDNCAEEGDTAEGTLYYAQRPWVEARLTVPDGAPALSAGINFGSLTLAELDAAIAPDGNVLPPPPAVGFSYEAFGPTPPRGIDSPWGIYIRELDCVCQGFVSRHFAEEYAANGVEC